MCVVARVVYALTCKVKNDARFKWACMAEHDRLGWAREARVQWSDRQEEQSASKELREEAEKIKDQRINDAFWGLSSRTSPVSEEALEAFLKQYCQQGQDEQLGGHRSYAVPLREEALKSIIVKSDCIPKNRKINAVVPCWKRHPGVCCTRDKWCMED